MRSLARSFFVLSMLVSCTDGSEYARATCVLVDESGTYADERANVVRIVRTALLPEMLPGDHLILGRIDSKSFERSNIVAALHLDPRPSRAHAQKLAFLKALDAFGAAADRSRHTDIRGGMMLCAEHLLDTGAALRTIIVFSDMKEDLPRGVVRDLAPDQLRGITVLAMNVKKLEGDNANPTVYRERLERWQSLLESSGASDFEVLVAPERLIARLEQGR